MTETVGFVVPGVLGSIVQGVLEDVQERQSHTSLDELKERAGATVVRDALPGLRTAKIPRIIAEVKRSSPSKGALADIPDPAALASEYEKGGASVISVLTEQRRFSGSLDDLVAVRQAVSLPVLRKDFIVNEYQVWESRAYGADVVLLIVAALPQETLESLLQLTESLGMNALVETHSVAEINRAVAAGARIIGVNTRDLTTLDVDRSVFETLVGHIPAEAVIVAESGVRGLEDVQHYVAQGAQAVLVGEALVTHGNPQATVASFVNEGSATN